MLFHHISPSHVRPGYHLYRWRNLKLFEGIAVQNDDDTSQIFVVMFDGLNNFRLVTLCEFKGIGILRRVLYDQGDSYVHLIKLSGTSYTEKSRPLEEIVQNALLLFDISNRHPEFIKQFFNNGFGDFAKSCCTISHEDWRNQLLVSTTIVDKNKMEELENKIEELKDQQCCSICMDRPNNIAFTCGHLACSKCAQSLKECHMCRKDIHQKITLYWT